MGHLTVQLGAALVVPIGTLSRKSTDTSGWEARSLREASAWDAGLPVRNHAHRLRTRRAPLLPGDVPANVTYESNEV